MNMFLLGLNIPVKSVMQYETFRERILSRYKKLGDKVHFADNNCTITTRPYRELSRGCQACKKGTWLCIYIGLRCNASCRFCSRALLNVHKDEPEGYQLKMKFGDLIDTIVQQETKVEGVSFSGGEPLLYLEDKVLPIAKAIIKRKHRMYQWIYTNGKLLNSENIRKLRDVGIKEVRLNLAATRFSKEVINKIPLIKQTIGKVTIEVPSIPEVFKKLIGQKLIYRIIELGVDQINLAELYIMQRKALVYIKNRNIYIKDSIVSPTNSRNLTVDIISYVIENNLRILVNDCSNDSKFWQIEKRAPLENLTRIYS